MRISFGSKIADHEFKSYPNILPSCERPGKTDVKVRASIGELRRENFSRPDVDPDAVKSWPRNPVSVQGEEFADAAGQQVQLGALLV